MAYKLIKSIKPNSYVHSVYDINYPKVFENGIRYIVYDVDATITSFDNIHLEEEIRILFRYINNLGLKAALFSSGFEKRVKPVAEALGVKYISGAPKPFASFDMIRSMFGKDCTEDNTMYVGDSLFFDMIQAERCHIYKILVDMIEGGEKIKLNTNKIMQAIMYHTVASTDFNFKCYYRGYKEK